jgi:hypothetical protein
VHANPNSVLMIRDKGTVDNLLKMSTRYSEQYGTAFVRTNKKSLCNYLKFRGSMPVDVPKAGIEPARPKAHDFESCASTSSATQACLLQGLDH